MVPEPTDRSASGPGRVWRLSSRTAPPASGRCGGRIDRPPWQSVLHDNPHSVERCNPRSAAQSRASAFRIRRNLLNSPAAGRIKTLPFGGSVNAGQLPILG
jgi:hypothetical protein